MYNDGKSIAAGKPAEGLSPEDATKAKQFYDRLHTAFCAASNETDVLKWEDMVSNKGEGSFIANLASHRHAFWWNDDIDKITTDVRSMSQTDWQNAKKHPEWRDGLRTMLRTMNKSPEEIDQTLRRL